MCSQEHENIKRTTSTLFPNLPRNGVVKLSNSLSRYSQGRKTFLASSAQRQARNFDKKGSNHNPSQLAITKRQWDRQIDRQIDMQINRYRYRYTYVDIYIYIYFFFYIYIFRFLYRSFFSIIRISQNIKNGNRGINTN